MTDDASSLLVVPDNENIHGLRKINEYLEATSAISASGSNTGSSGKRGSSNANANANNNTQLQKTILSSTLDELGARVETSRKTLDEAAKKGDPNEVRQPFVSSRWQM